MADLDAVYESVRTVLQATGHRALSDYLDIAPCADADAENAASERQFAHVDYDHGAKCSIICVAEALWHEPTDVQRGILWHETGHLLVDANPDEADEALRLMPHFEAEAAAIHTGKPADYIREEALANAIVFDQCGIRITYGEDQVQRA